MDFDLVEPDPYDLADELMRRPEALLALATLCGERDGVSLQMIQRAGPSRDALNIAGGVRWLGSVGLLRRHLAGSWDELGPAETVSLTDIGHAITDSLAALAEWSASRPQGIGTKRVN
jgi:hypothetical protein